MAIDPTHSESITDILSALVPAWQQLKKAILALPPSDIRTRLLLHVESGIEAYWRRDIDNMHAASNWIITIMLCDNCGDSIREWAEAIHDRIEELVLRRNRGEWL